jgi:hypothetical protein
MTQSIHFVSWKDKETKSSKHGRGGLSSYMDQSDA